MNLSPHFTLEELTASDVALRRSIDNRAPPHVVDNLRSLASGLEAVRRLLGFPISINSGYRCTALNAAVGGARSSAHLLGFACDFTCPGFGAPIDVVRESARSKLRFDQLIQEGTWVHLSFDVQLRGDVLTAHFGPGGTTYTRGLQDAARPS